MESYKAKRTVAAYQAEQKQRQEETDRTLRQSYATARRNAAVLGQTARAAGQSGGVVRNQYRALRDRLKAENEQTRRQSAQDIADLQSKINAVEEDERERLAALAEKEAEAAAKAAQKAATKSSSRSSSSRSSSSRSSSSSSKKPTKSQILSMMKMGIYDASFADLLGIPDSEVRKYIKSVQSKTDEEQKKTEKAKSNSRWYTNGSADRLQQLIASGK